MTYLERYLSGEDVWKELISLGDSVHGEAIRDDALAVAHCIVDRVLDNVESLVARLEAVGFEFGWYNSVEPVPYYHGPIQRPGPNTPEVLQQIEALIGTLPLLFRVWQEKIGGVDFRGYHPEWDLEFPDLIVVYRFNDNALQAIRSDYQDWHEYSDDVEPFRVPIAPDYYHKANVSGGEAYKLTVPCSAIDERVLNEPHYTYFRDYLTICMEWGGFPGIARDSDGIPREHFELLKQGLLWF